MMMSIGTLYGAVYEETEWEAILSEHLPQVHYLARHVHDRLPKHVPLDDLVHAGVIGLMDAVRKFDPRKEVQFKTYAKFRIRGAILDSLREMDWSPRNLRRKSREVEDASVRLAMALGREPIEQEIAEELNMSLAAFQQLLGELGGLEVGSLQYSPDGSDEGYDLTEAIADPTEENPFESCLKGELRQHLATAISGLSEREQQILSLYYYEELTMKDIGEVLGVGESRVSQIHSLAIMRLRTQLRGEAAARMLPIPRTIDMGGQSCRRY
jgi:RNA polymerase sigma factor FliA